MAEKIIDIKLNAKEAIKAVQDLDDSIEELEGGVSDLQRGLNDLERELSEVTGASGKDLAKRKQLNKVIAKTKANLKQEKEALKQNVKQRQRANKTLTVANTKLKEQAKAHNEVSKGLTKTIGGTGVLDQATGGLFSRFQGLAQGLKATTSGLGKFKLALIGTGVGALVVALGSLVAAFTASEEGQNKLTKALNQAKAVIANTVELFSQLGNGIINTFSAVGKFITGKGSLSEVGDALGDTFDTVSEKISNFSEDIKEDVKLAGELSDSLAKADKIDRKLMVERQKANTKVNELRTKAYNTEKFNAEERIKFLEEAITIEDAITNKEIEAARLRFEAKKKENEMTSLARTEDLDEQAKLEAKLFELEAKKTNRQREVENQRQMLLRKKKKEEEKERADALKIENDRLQSLEDIKNEFDQKEKERDAVSELQKVELEEANQLAELEALNASEEAKQQVRDFYLEEKDKARKTDEEKAAEQRQREKEEELALAQAKASINMMAADNVGKAFALIGKMAGKNRALQAAAIIGENAAGIAKQIISTKAANAAVTLKYAAIPGGVALAAAEKTMNNVSLGLGIAGSIAATQKALSSLKSGGTASAPSVGGGRGEGGQAPAFNVVGAAPENQLAQAIGEKESQPLRAYVVTNEITNAQALERNIINESTIG